MSGRTIPRVLVSALLLCALTASAAQPPAQAPMPRPSAPQLTDFPLPPEPTTPAPADYQLFHRWRGLFDDAPRMADPT
ncbi:MAG: hypothetical protein K2V38_04040, partial [Gemmataceae bacterium]|nr:hypothetical protein [Gemmataceae bacterium]